ncbi:MAG TPA: hypothetical protein VH682_22080 [Gemmataceae bacterium]|jgi:hypothetical protein
MGRPDLHPQHLLAAANSATTATGNWPACLISTDRGVVDNGASMDGVWQNLVDAGQQMFDRCISGEPASKVA